MSDTQNTQPNLPPKNYNIFYTGEISSKAIHHIRISFGAAFSNPHKPSVNFFLSSWGGDLHSALTLYNFLRISSVPITIYNTGTIESAAVIIYMAAETRLTVADSWFLIHSMSQDTPHNTVDVPRFSEMNRTHEKYAEIYAKIVEERTKGAASNLDVYERVIGNASSLIIDPAAALETGIVTGIVPAEGIIFEPHDISDHIMPA